MSAQQYKRLARFWDAARDGRYRGWHCEHWALDHATRKDGLSHTNAFAQLLGLTPQPSEIQSWALSSTATEWKAAAAAEPVGEKPLWIYKPASSSCGQGIVVGDTKDMEQIVGRNQGTGVIQRYTAPMLIGGLKWDLRCYCVLLHPAGQTAPQLFLFLDGLARFATQAYNESVSTDTNWASQHLTNYSIQSDSVTAWKTLHSLFGILRDWLPHALQQLIPQAKQQHASGFIEALDAAGSGGVDAQGRVLCHKWSAAAALGYSHWQGSDSVEELWDKIGAAASTAISAGIVSSQSASYLTSEFETPNSRRFELLGVDILLDWRGEPRLLELQRRPCLDPTSALDFRVKSQLLEGLNWNGVQSFTTFCLQG